MKIGSRSFDFSRPVVMGILNITPDSFSDGGKFVGHDAAVSHAMRMIEEGADIIDVGGESSRPGAEAVSAKEELARVIPIIGAIRKRSDIPISIDTTKAAVAAEAISVGASMINDISAGRFDAEMFAVAARYNLPICLMHMKGTPKTMQTGEIHYDDVMGEISEFLLERIRAAEKEGVRRDNIIIDPGIGFGKKVEHNIIILRELGRLKQLGCRTLVGVSRKSFIGKLLGDAGPEDRLHGTLAATAVAVKNGADILRVHDVAPTMRFLSIFLRCNK